MTNNGRTRVFIGSGEASRIERKVLMYSLLKHGKDKVDIYVFNGTHNTVEPPIGDPFPAPLSLKAKYANVTEFSNYRFLIPELCAHEGRAIWLDSDMLVLADIGELFNTPMHEAAILARSEAYGGTSQALWGLSVALFDCSRVSFAMDAHMADIENGVYTYSDLHQMSPAFLRKHPVAMGALDPQWNVFDRCDSGTKLIHYTNLFTQPWKFPGHRHASLWFRYFEEARTAGVVTDEDIDLSKARAYVRQDILDHRRPWRRVARKAVALKRQLFG